jgi:hypothetical protein
VADDEAATLRSLNDAREIFRKRIDAHGGRLIDTAGDSILAEFPSAVEIQHEIAKRNAQLIEHRRLQFHIGINLGDVIEHEDGTIYRDGVNISARVQSLAEPGGICISGTAFDQVEGKLALDFKFTGEQQVKNIPKRVRAYRIRVHPSDGAMAPSAGAKRGRSAPLAGMGALAVLIAALGARPARDFVTQRTAKLQSETVFRVDPILAIPKGPGVAVLPFASLCGGAVAGQRPAPRRARWLAPLGGHLRSRSLANRYVSPSRESRQGNFDNA